MNGYDFLRKAARALNSGQSRSLVFSGNINDLFRGEGGYVPLIDYLCDSWSVPGKIVITYELNGPVHFKDEDERKAVENAWVMWRSGMSTDGLAIKNMLDNGRTARDVEFYQQSFAQNVASAVGKPAVAFEFLRQLCLCSRSSVNGQKALAQDLVIIIEAADMLLPEGEITHLSEADRHRVCICHDWFCDPGFLNGDDSVVLLCESRSLLNGKISRLPQLYEVPVPLPDEEERKAFIDGFRAALPEGKSVEFAGGMEDLVTFSAGMTQHALLQLLKAAGYSGETISMDDLIAKVEEHVCAQLGEGVVEFKKPSHTLQNVVGFAGLKNFLREEFIPRCRGGKEIAYSGAGVCGPIGGGKSFIFEAVASELGFIVLVLKNLRSQWFGQTDVIFERLYRLLCTMPKVLIFVDEADTQFGGVGADAHPTERRLTGKIQAMMSDPALRGRVIWLLMTARINLLSPDLRRPGRVGDLIIPVLDPDGDDRVEFIQWVAKKALGRAPLQEEIAQLEEIFGDKSAAAFSSLRSEFAAQRKILGHDLSLAEMRAVVEDRLEPDIAPMRRYQELQAMLNCTRRSLLPKFENLEAEREMWVDELRLLESKGYR